MTLSDSAGTPPPSCLGVCLFSSLETSRWITREELETLLVETISTHEVRTVCPSDENLSADSAERVLLSSSTTACCS